MSEINKDYDYTEAAVDVIRVYASLLSYDPELKREKLDKLTSSYTVLADILKNADKEENQQDIFLIEKMLNTQQAASIEDKRKKRLSEVKQLAKEGKLSDVGVLLPPSELTLIGNQIMDFFADYNPYDFASSQDGYFDRAGEPTQAFEAALLNNDMQLQLLLADLTADIARKDVEKKEAADAEDLIKALSKYVDNPVPETLRYIEAFPGKIAEIKQVENTPHVFDEYDGRIMIEKNLGDGMYVSFDKEAVNDGLPKNRILYNEDGQRAGATRGTMVFYARDQRGNLVNLTEAQHRRVMELYGRPTYKPNEENKVNDTQTLTEKETGISNDRAQTLVKNTVEQLSENTMGKQLLKNIGYTNEEIAKISKKKETTLNKEEQQQKLS